MDIKETILNQRKALKRIEELQEFMHGTSMLALGLHEDGVIGQPEDKLIFFETCLLYTSLSPRDNDSDER